MTKILAEIHRRSLWQVLGIYLAGSWVALQVAREVTESVGLPEWVPGAAIVLLVIGFPIVMATAFVQKGAVGSDAWGGAEASSRPEGGPARAGSTPVGEAAGAAGGVGDPAAASGAEASVAPLSAGSVAGGKSRSRRLFTWRNAIAGGLGAFALLGLATAAYMAMRTLGIGPAGTLVAKGVLDERERVLVADFSSASGDSSLDTAVTEAFRVDLSQSPAVVVVEPARVATVLGRMNRDPGERLALPLALEVAQREGIKAVVGGQVDAAGSGYVLTASLVMSANGETVASAREAAADPDEVIGAIDDLSYRLRERIGESLRSIHNTPSLERVTTPSLDALRYYSQSERAVLMQGEQERAFALLEEAVALDTAFAMAWRKLGVMLANRGEERSRSLEALERALAHADRLPDRERFLTQASYYQATGEREKAVTALETLLEIDPDDTFALHNLAVLNEQLRDPARAEELYLAAYANDSVALTLSNLAMARASQGKWKEAEETLARYRELHSHNPVGVARSANLASARFDYEVAAELYRQLAREHGDNLYWRGQASYGLAGLAAATGQVVRAVELLQEAGDVAESREVPAEAVRAACYAALLRLTVTGDSAGAIGVVEAALAETSLAQVDPLDRPYLELAAVYALAGEVGRARETLAEFEEAVPSMVQTGFSPMNHHFVRGELALAEGRHADAADAFRRADDGFCSSCALPRLALALERAGQVEEALITYEQYLEMPDPGRLGWVGQPIVWPYGDWLFLGPTYERLGQLYDERDEVEKAAEYYARFVELWAEADAALQPRVRAAQERLEEIVRERG